MEYPQTHTNTHTHIHTHTHTHTHSHTHKHLNQGRKKNVLCYLILATAYNLISQEMVKISRKKPTLCTVPKITINYP